MKNSTNRFPRLENSIEYISTRAAFLDTRGYIHLQLGDHIQALRDLETAADQTLIILELARQNWKRMEAQHEIVEPREMKMQLIDQPEHSAAVILYHRALANQQNEISEAAEQDMQRVKKLGYTPDKHLF